MLSAKTLERKTEALLLIASLETEKGLRHPDAQRILKKYPEELAVELISILITSRPGVKRMMAMNNAMDEFVHEKDPEDIRDCLRDVVLELASLSDPKEAANTDEEH